LDYQVKPTLSWHGTWNLRSSDFTKGTVPYPNSPYDFVGPNGTNIHSSATPYVATSTVDWTIRQNLINSAIFGVQGNGENFFINADPHRLSILRALTVAIVVASISGFIAGLIKTCSGAGFTPEELNNRLPMMVHGFAESCTNLVFGGAFVVITWVLVAVGVRRMPHDPA